MSPLPALAAAMMMQAPASPAFDPVAFFEGRTEGEGRVKIIFKDAKTLRVESVGTRERDGTLALKQVIAEPGKPPRTRYWRLKALGGGRYSGTLTDAVGPVRIETVGTRIHIRYKAKDHLDYDQWLTPAGPRRVDNRMRVKRFGLTVAHVEEVISKRD